MTGIVVKEENSPTIELNINERGQLLRSTLRIDNIEQRFTEKEWFTQEYNGLCYTTTCTYEWDLSFWSRLPYFLL